MSEVVLKQPISSLIWQSCKRFESTRRSSQAIRAFTNRTTSASQLRQRLAADATPSKAQQEQPSHLPAPLTQTAKSVPRAGTATPYLTDTFGRNHTYLRISVTERCNLRCLYCMPEDGVSLSPPEHLLSTPEIVHLSRLFVSQGVNKIRLTGGEPTVRKDIVGLMEQIGQLRTLGLKELCLTTNGLNLTRKLDGMVDAGLTGVNLSLDTLDPHQFVIMTRRNGHAAVLRSIDRILEMNQLGAAIKLKINCVVMRGINEREILPFVELGRERDVEVRFIEYMPFDGNKWSKGKMVGYTEMLALIREKYSQVCKVQDHPNDTSKTYHIPGFVGRFGFITSMTHNFCGTCNRLRITGDGNLKVCLFGNAEVSLRDMLRERSQGQPIVDPIEPSGRIQHGEGQAAYDGPSAAEDDRLLQLVGAAVSRKKAKHAGMGELENMKNRPMILIDEPHLKSKQPLLTPQYRSLQPQSTLTNCASWLTVATHQQPRVPLMARLYHSSIANANVPTDNQDSVPTSSGSTSVPTEDANVPTDALDKAFKQRRVDLPLGIEQSLVRRVVAERKIDRVSKRLPKKQSRPQSSPPTSLVEEKTTSTSTSSQETPPTVPPTQPSTDPAISEEPPNELTHLTPDGAVRMVDISAKSSTHRSASASAILLFSRSSTAAILAQAQLKKGDPLSVARIAGIQAVKRTADLIPLAHPSLAITSAQVNITALHPRTMHVKLVAPSPGAGGGLFISAHVTSEGKTGIEMEALTAATVAALTLYDMCKSIDRHMELRSARVVAKSGGKSGDWSLDGKAIHMAFAGTLNKRDAETMASVARHQAGADRRLFGEMAGEEMWKMARAAETSLGEEEENRGPPLKVKGKGAARADNAELAGSGVKWAEGLWHEWSRQYKRSRR